MSVSNQPLPITILSGIPDSGKSELLNALIERASEQRVAVIVNQLGSHEAGIAKGDGGALSAACAQSATDPDALVIIKQGCVCCSLAAKLHEAALRISRRKHFDCLVVDTNGISDPLAVAHAVDREPEDGAVSELQLESIVTVVNAKTFFELIQDGSEVVSRYAEAGEDDDRSVADLVVEQIEAADRVVLSNVEATAPEWVSAAADLIGVLNPEAVVHMESARDLDPGLILGAGTEEISRSTKAGREAPARFSRLTFSSKTPFHPERLRDFLDSSFWDDVIRTRGVIWLASRQQLAISLAITGKSCRLAPAGLWSAEEPARQDLVFVVKRMDGEQFLSKLSECLLTKSELALGEAQLKKLDDPFPELPVAE